MPDFDCRAALQSQCSLNIITNRIDTHQMDSCFHRGGRHFNRKREDFPTKSDLFPQTEIISQWTIALYIDSYKPKRKACDFGLGQVYRYSTQGIVHTTEKLLTWISSNVKLEAPVKFFKDFKGKSQAEKIFPSRVFDLESMKS